MHTVRNKLTSCDCDEQSKISLLTQHQKLSSIVHLHRYRFGEDTEASISLIQIMRQDLQRNGVITLPNFLQPSAIQSVVREALDNKHKAYYTDPKSTLNIYLKQNDPSKPSMQVDNRRISSSKGCITTDQIPSQSLLKIIYHDPLFQQFLQKILEVKKLYPYKDPLSSINVHYASEGQELGWHFDNSAFAITLLLQRPEDGGVFQYLPNVRDLDDDSKGVKDAIKAGMEKEVEGAMDGKLSPKKLDLNPGTLVIFRGRESLHRVTKVVGNTTRILVVFAYNEKEGIELSEEARLAFFGRTGT